MEKRHFDVERLKAIPFSLVVERWGGKLRRVGTRQVTNCVWHDDEHPSMTLYESGGENHCHCFACGQGGSVIDYVMALDGVDFPTACERLESAFFGNGAASVMTSGWNRRNALKRQKKREPSYIPREWLDEHVSVENSLCRCLVQMFDVHRVEHLTEEYRLGCYDNGRYEDCVLFPSIDVEGRVRNVKVQHYETDVHSPRFAHADKKCCYWLGAQLLKEAVFDNECLFGEHLLRRYARQTVALVESPKNAIIGAAVQPKYVWVATGNKAMLKRNVMEPLRNRQVIVFPDRDAISEWKTLLHGMRDIATFTVSDFCERMAPDADRKFDIADYVVNTYLDTHFFRPRIARMTRI
jgi:hypothetical protein